MAKPEAHEVFNFNSVPSINFKCFEVNPSRQLLRVIKEKLSQEIRSFAADAHNVEIQKGLETALNKLTKGPTQERLDVAF
jgi:hypothetical protein